MEEKNQRMNQTTHGMIEWWPPKKENVTFPNNPVTVIEKYMAQSLHIGLYWPCTKLPFGIGKPSILTWR